MVDDLLFQNPKFQSSALLTLCAMPYALCVSNPQSSQSKIQNLKSKIIKIRNQKG